MPHRTLSISQLVFPLFLVAAFTSIAAGVDQPVVGLGYIGPGAGIAVLGSFLAVLAALVSAIGAMLMWPMRWLWRAMRGRRGAVGAKVKRVLIVGLDGLEPTLADQFLDEGLLPNLARLRDSGTYARLGTTCPPLSPVAWSSFSTGTNPGKHNIFDFINRHPSDYRPRMSSVRIEPGRRSLKLGSRVVPLSRPSITALRKSKPFWTVLGESGVFSAILRVPITFPPDKFHGVQLSAMCVPDLRGSQGMFTYYTEGGQSGATMDGDVGGERILVTRNRNRIESYLPGPPNSFRTDQPEVRLPFQVAKNRQGQAVLHLDGQSISLTPGQYTPWVRVSFPLAAGIKASGTCRFLLRRFDPRLELYCTPVQIDPDKPVMPISHPRVYSTYLSRLLGPFATLGLAEDTWALSEGVISEGAFLTQVYDIHDERRRMLLDALRRVKRGLVACVFDAPDRVQHMFWRFMDRDHPAWVSNENGNEHAIRDMYVKMDQTLGELLEQIGDDTAVIVMSDHGFKPFRRGVDLNAWLLANGYLKLKDNAEVSDQQYLAEVDWSQTRAFAIGLAGIFINQRGREAQGIVDVGPDYEQLVEELAAKLTGLKDPDGREDGQVAVYEAIPRQKAYSGPYVDTAPDLIVGYNVGYRVSWDAAVGKCGRHVFTDNTKAWSGDHCVHPDLVPGVVFSNLKLKGDQANIIDIAPTVLELLGVAKPSYMDGRSLLCDEPDSS